MTAPATGELDLLVLGSGVAGLSAAVRASNEHGLDTGVLTKGLLEQSTTRWAQGGVAAALSGDAEEVDLHLADTPSLDLLVERFHPWNALAHTLLTFGFSDGRHVVISVEVRREIGESFDPIAGLFRQLELMYVLGTESDLIGLRTNFRKSHAWLYPIRTTKERIRKLFRSMLARAKHLQTSPEFYNTLTSTCTTNIVDHVLDLAPDRFDPDWRVLLPGYVATLAYEAGLIDTDLSFDAMQEAFRIDDIAQAGPVDTVYSQRIRSGRPARVTGEPPR